MDRSKKGEGQQFHRQPKKPDLSLRCLINHDAMTFVVESDPDWEVGDLKPVIHVRAVHGILRDTVLGQHQNPTPWITCGLYKGTQRF